MKTLTALTEDELEQEMKGTAAVHGGKAVDRAMMGYLLSRTDEAQLRFFSYLQEHIKYVQERSGLEIPPFVSGTLWSRKED